MTTTQATHIESAIRAAVTATIAQVGIAGLKATSMFLSNERSSLKKAA